MNESGRLYPRKTLDIPVTIIPDELPIVASHTDILPLSPMGIVERSIYGASMKNSSVDGLCVVTGKKLRPGTEMQVKMLNFRPFPMGDRRYSECDAKVVWCNLLTETGLGKCYEVGAKIIRKDSLPIINWEKMEFASIRCV